MSKHAKRDFVVLETPAGPRIVDVATAEKIGHAMGANWDVGDLYIFPNQEYALRSCSHERGLPHLSVIISWRLLAPIEAIQWCIANGLTLPPSLEVWASTQENGDPPPIVEPTARFNDGEIVDGRIWLKDTWFALTPGLRNLCSFILQNPGISTTKIIHHFQFDNNAHLQKRLTDLRNELKGEAKGKSKWNLHISSRENRISYKWVNRT